MFIPLRHYKTIQKRHEEVNKNIIFITPISVRQLKLKYRNYSHQRKNNLK